MVDVILPEVTGAFVSELGVQIKKCDITEKVSLILADVLGDFQSKAPSMPHFKEILEAQSNLSRDDLVSVYNKFICIVCALYHSPASMEEFKTIVAELGIPESLAEDCVKPYSDFMEIQALRRRGQEGARTLAEKVPGGANEQIVDGYLSVRFAELVNVEWTATQSIASVHSSAIYEPKYTLKLFILTNECDIKVSQTRTASESFHELRIKVVEFVCTLPELQHFLYQANEALYEAERISGN